MSHYSSTLKSLLLLLLYALTCSASAQSLLNGGKIPDDLMITLKRQGGWGGGVAETTISATGNVTSEYKGGLPTTVRDIPILSVDGKVPKPAKYLKPHLSVAKLRWLIHEFETIRFFDFGKDFPTEDNENSAYSSDQGTDIISIRINGKTKEISNYLGNNLKRTRMLVDLATKISGATIWNFENDEIPENFHLWYQVTGVDRIVRDFKIGADGQIIKATRTLELFKKDGQYVPRITKPKRVGKLSKTQVTNLIDELQNVGFSTFKYSILSKYDGCSKDESGYSRRIGINVQINRSQQMYASLYENCEAKLGTNAEKFEQISETIKNILTGAIEGKGSKGF